jgi:hypothetical protein
MHSGGTFILAKSHSFGVVVFPRSRMVVQRMMKREGVG